MREIIILPHNFLHEGCHYLAARLLGFEAKFNLSQIMFYPQGINWRVYGVVLAPAMGGLSFLALSVGLAIASGVYNLIFLAALLNIIWQPACLRDFYCAWYLAQYHAWPADSCGPQNIPWLRRLP